MYVQHPKLLSSTDKQTYCSGRTEYVSNITQHSWIRHQNHLISLQSPNNQLIRYELHLHITLSLNLFLQLQQNPWMQVTSIHQLTFNRANSKRTRREVVFQVPNDRTVDVSYQRGIIGNNNILVTQFISLNIRWIILA